MEKPMVTCPACGESVPYARRCRKCAALLDESLIKPPPQELASPQPFQGEDRYEVSLIWADAADENASRAGSTGGQAPGQYFLRVMDRSGYTREKRIPVEAKSGMTLARWKITRLEPHPILSVYFYISSAGHDLDGWFHYDLITGQKLGMNQGDEQDPNPAAQLGGKTLR